MLRENEICETDAVCLACAVRSKKLSPLKVVDACFKRARPLEPTLHAFCMLTPDLARKRAKDIDALIAKGDGVGLREGVPVEIKDLVCTAAIRTVSGSIAQPATSIPVGFTDDELRVGLQIVGRHLDDPLVLKASATFEKARAWKGQRLAVLNQKGNLLAV
jgi:Asp-tRNA(Asn)/Glu-tRNA(Gln) amidotransferase A subunit family amidase